MTHPSAVSSAADVTILTTSETVVARLRLRGSLRGQKLVAIGWCLVQTGTGTTAVVQRIDEGFGGFNNILGETGSENVKAAAGSVEPFSIVWAFNAGQDDAEYTYTVQQVTASGNGTILIGTFLLMYAE